VSKDGNNNRHTYIPISGDLHDEDEYKNYSSYVRGILLNTTRTPKKFTPCLRCGYCCRKSICAVAYYELGRPSEPMDEIECPFLEHDGFQYGCKLADKYPKDLHIGIGCCASLNSDRMRMEKKIAERNTKRVEQA